MRLARQLANVVIVSIHWGNELQDWPADTQQQQARWLVAHGADLIVGHHPHVIQSPQCVDGKPVFFSLGNHLFDQKYGETKDGLIADCHIRGGQLSCGGLQTHTDANTSYPTLLGRDAAADNVLQGCTTPISAGLQVKGIMIKPAPWSRDQPEVGVVLEGYREDKLQWRSRRQELVSLQASSAMGTEPLLVSLERHPSSIDNELGLRPYVYAVGLGGLVARWRGSALAWPLLDAIITSDGVLCALHRDDSFLLADPETKGTRIAAYRWNGFGFSGVNTPIECAQNLQ
jgi:poly-gamma-glutamate synthesis protein (capsule biosynthesis protein)